MIEEEEVEEEIKALEEDAKKMQEGDEKQELLGYIRTVRKLQVERDEMFSNSSSKR